MGHKRNGPFARDQKSPIDSSSEKSAEITIASEFCRTTRISFDIMPEQEDSSSEQPEDVLADANRAIRKVDFLILPFIVLCFMLLQFVNLAPSGLLDS